MKKITHLHLAQRLGICGAIPLFPLYDFMVCAGITLPLPFSYVNIGLGDRGIGFDVCQEQLSYSESQ